MWGLFQVGFTRMNRRIEDRWLQETEVWENMMILLTAMKLLVLELRGPV